MWRGAPGTKLDTGWLPNIKGSFDSDVNGTAWLAFGPEASGAFYGIVDAVSNSLKATAIATQSSQRYRHIAFSAENSCNVFSNSNTNNWVLPRSISFYMIIKY